MAWAGRVERFEVVVPEKVVIYDIAEAIGDSEEAVAEYTTTLRLPPSFPVPVVSGLGVRLHCVGGHEQCDASADHPWRE